MVRDKVKTDQKDNCGCPHAEKIPTHKKTINLAIQGGGSHGAFAWGVIDFLLNVAMEVVWLRMSKKESYLLSFRNASSVITRMDFT